MGRWHPEKCPHGVLMGGDECFGHADKHCHQCDEIANSNRLVLEMLDTTLKVPCRTEKTIERDGVAVRVVMERIIDKPESD